LEQATRFSGGVVNATSGTLDGSHKYGFKVTAWANSITISGDGTLAGSDICAFVFNSQADIQNNASPLQTIAYTTSGSQAIYPGDQIGRLTVVGYVGSNDGHSVS
jgi:hypothetical protein